MQVRWIGNWEADHDEVNTSTPARPRPLLSRVRSHLPREVRLDLAPPLVSLPTVQERLQTAPASTHAGGETGREQESVLDARESRKPQGRFPVPLPGSMNGGPTGVPLQVPCSES